MLRVAMISVHTCPLARLGSRETGGMNVYIRELSRHLGARDVKVDVFTRRQDTGTPEVVEFADNARVIHLEAGPPRPMDKYSVLEQLPHFSWSLGRFREREGLEYQLVHSHYWLSSRVAGLFAETWKVPLVTMFHTLGRLKNRVMTNGHERERLARIQIEREAMLGSNLVVAASPTDMEQMVRYYGAPPSRIQVVPGGVDTAIFRPTDRSMARHLLGMGPEKQLLFVGRIQQLKGIDLLLKAFGYLLEGWGSEPKPRLTVVGGRNPVDASDPEAMEMERLRGLVRELGLTGSVVFQGAVPQQRLPLYYSAADVVVVPSLYESFGLVALEAMACGAPVVASRVGGLQWTVKDGETGFLVRRRNPGLFAIAVGRILRDGDLHARLSRRAVEVAGGYSWDMVADRILDIYRKLAPAPRSEGRLVCHC